jgi:PAS domain S-box-containing protein
MQFVYVIVSFLQKGWKLLTEPLEALPKMEDRRRAIITSTVALFSFLAFVLDQLLAGRAPLVALVILLASYFLARTRWFKPAALILLITLSIPSFLFALTIPAPNPNEIFAALAWLTLPLILSSLLYSTRAAILYSAANILSFLALPLMRSELNLEIVGLPICFYALTSLIVIVVMIQRNEIEKDHQSELIESRDQLSKEAAQRELFAEQAQRRADQFVILNEVGRVISSLNGLENALDLILEQVQRNIPLDLFYVALYDENSGMVSFPLMFDYGKKYQEKPLPLDELPRISQTIRTGQSILANRGAEELKFVPGDIQLGDRTRLTASIMMSPLYIGSRVAGVISAQSYTVALYTDEHLMLLTAIARQVAIAIENARLFEQTTKRAQQLAILNEIGREISTLSELPTLMENVYQQVARALSTDLFFIGIFDKEKNEISFPIMYDHGRRWEQPPIQVTDGTFSGKAILARRPLLINRWVDTVKEGESKPVIVGDAARVTQSMMFVPMLFGNETIGVISIQSYTPNAYSEEDLSLLSGIANQVAIAIQNARLLEETKQNAGHLSILNELGHVVTELRDLPSLLEVINEQVKKHLSVDAFYVGLYNPGNNTVSYPIVYDEGVQYLSNPDDLTPGSYLYGLMHGEPARLILRTEKEVELTPTDTGMLGNETKRSASLMIAPLKVGEQIIGVISTQSYTFNAYTKEDLNLLVGIANQVSVAIENSRLYTSAQQEIKERLRAEMELQRERDFAVQVMNTLGQGVAVSGLDGIYEYINPAYASMLGYVPEEMIGKLSDNFVHPDDLERLNEETARRYLGEATTYEIRLLHKDGHIVHALITGVPRYANGKIIGAIAAVTDLTERKLAEIEREKLLKEMEKKNAELERFTYTVSHDLKSPLVTIAGFLGFLEIDIQQGNYSKVPRTMTRIHEATKKMQRLLDELLELSRVGRIANPPVDVPFGELVGETLELVEGQLRERQVEVRVEAELPVVRVDRVRMIEVIQNLIVNAIKFMGEQTSPLIEIGSRVENGQPVFFVKDNGSGIAPQFHDRIFGLFNKLDALTDGTGIGLALVKRIIEVHGGKIWVQSEPGKGATFFFTLG